MTTIEALALKGTALRIQMRNMDKAFKTMFIDPVKAWLEGMPDKRAIVAGIARPIIVMPIAKPVLNEHEVLEDFRHLVSSGAITHDQLKIAVLDGSLGVGSPDLLLSKVISATGATRDSYMASVVSGVPALRWDCVRDGLEDHLKFGVDLGSVVNDFANAPVSDSVAADIAAKAATAVVAIDAARAQAVHDRAAKNGRVS